MTPDATQRWLPRWLIMLWRALLGATVFVQQLQRKTTTASPFTSTSSAVK